MARFPIFASAAAMVALLSASPIASATGQDQDVAAVIDAQATLPAQNANMLPMQLCGDREQVVSELSQVFDESALAVGQVDGNAVVEIFASSTGSWTILATGTDGMSCIVSAGEGFESTNDIPGVDA